MSSYLFTGQLMHSRRSPVKNAFTYPLFMLLLDLDELPDLDRRLALFGYNRPNLVALRSRDHLGDPRLGIHANLQAHLAANGLSLPGGKTYMLTNPRIAGYGFNPVSFYYCLDAAGALACVVAEVNNTFGVQHAYTLSAGNALPPAAGRPAHRYWADKRFYVSPFIEMDARYEFGFSPPGPAMHLTIDEYQAGQKFFQARLWGTRQPLTNRTLLAALLRYPLMTLQIISLIHWQALKLKRLGAPWVEKT